MLKYFYAADALPIFIIFIFPQYVHTCSIMTIKLDLTRLKYVIFNNIASQTD